MKRRDQLGRRLTQGSTSVLLLCALAGCRARFVQATVTNDSEQTLHVVEVDYPGASFGCSTLAPHAGYRYRFKAIGSGALGLSYNDAQGAAHTFTGPVVGDGQGGTLTIRIGANGKVSWANTLDAK